MAFGTTEHSLLSKWLSSFVFCDSVIFCSPSLLWFFLFSPSHDLLFKYRHMLSLQLTDIQALIWGDV